VTAKTLESPAVAARPPQPGCHLDRATLAGVALIFLGFAARVWFLGYQSLWLDEALSVVFSARPLGELFSTLTNVDLHPPLFYLLLHFWMKLAGQSEFSVRFVALALGLPTIPATYCLGRALFRRGGVAIGLAGAFLCAISPFLVYYSQEARMYSGLASFGLLSSYTLWKLLTTGQPRWWWGYVAFTTLLIYTQYFGGLIVGFQAVYLLGALVRRQSGAERGVLGLAVTGVLYLPWLPFAIRQMQRLFNVPDFWKGELSLSFMLGHLFGVFALGQFEMVTRFGVLALILALVFLVGLVLLVRQAVRREDGSRYLLAYLAIPLAALYAVLAQNPKFTERYLIAIAPPFYLALALGVVELVLWIRGLRNVLARRVAFAAPALIAIMFVATSLSQLWQVYYGPGYRKDDNRGAIAYIRQNYQPGDVVVLLMNTYQSFVYYSSNDELTWAPLQPGTDQQAGADGLNQILTGHQRAWFLLWNADWGDPTNYVRQSIDQTYPRLAITQSFTGLDLRLYAIDHPPHFVVATAPSNPAPVNFANRVQMLGYDLPQSTITAGESGQVSLYWQTLQPTNQDYAISLRLTDGRFDWWRIDRRPAADTFPTSYWSVSSIVKADHRIVVPPGTPPGTYYLEVGVYAHETGQDLNVLRDGKVPIGTTARFATVTILPSALPIDPTKLGLPQRRPHDFGEDLRLLSTLVDTPSAPPGGVVDITLWWQALRAGLPAYRVQLELQNGAYRHVVSDAAPASGSYPTDRWRSQEIVVDRNRFTIPADAPPGLFAVSARLIPPIGAPPAGALPLDPVVLGQITVPNRHPLLVKPASVETPVTWNFGSLATLIGYRLSASQARPGDHLHLTLYWRARGNSGTVAYTAFGHLLDAQSVIWAQQDHPPAGPGNPTSGWIAGEYVVDDYDLAIKPDAPPGSYVVEIGLYDPQNGARLPVVDANGAPAGDRVVLATVQLKP
jgi:uncharacterized membrane protein